ncbi:uncharacterized protein J3D65DRAFT_358008 [Phyllosticta citribraziliensis]|uniref:Uncharacterized protein n=1 Tax=Phyllosticta citribraziliensis TaxID=989973 RepID=A0ABR1LT01_9PEZI
MTDQKKYTTKLADQHVLILGGSSGIGLGLAEAVLEHGARVTIASSNAQRLATAVSQLSSAYPSAASKQFISSHVCDLGDPNTLEANIEALFAATTGTAPLQHVVFTAGEPLATVPLQEMDVGKAQAAGTVRFFAPLLVAKHAARALPATTGSSITLTSGSSGDRPPMANWGLIAAYAAGLFGMVRGLAVDLRPRRVNVVAPGAVETPLWATSFGERHEAMAKSIGEGLLTGEVGQVEQVVEAYLWCLKDRFVTGEVVRTNGGALIA